MRKFLAMLILLGYTAFCIFLLATLGSWMVGLPRLVQLIFYVVAGFIWIAPLRYLFHWMNSGVQFEDD